MLSTREGKAMKSRFLSVILVMVMFFSGCATITDRPTSPEAILFKGTIQLGIAQHIAGKPERAAEAGKLLLELRGHVEAGVNVSVAGLQTLAMTWMAWERLDVVSRIAFYYMILAASQYLEEQVGTGVLDPTEAVPVETFLGWLEEVIMLSKLGA